MSTGRTVRGADYRFYNTPTERFISADEVTVVLRRMERQFPAGNPTGWNYSEVYDGLRVQMRTFSSFVRR